MRAGVVPADYTCDMGRHGEGLVNAAEHSPALRLCGPEDVDPTDPGEGGGGPVVVS
jgi:hypothetical protein